MTLRLARKSNPASRNRSVVASQDLLTEVSSGLEKTNREKITAVATAAPRATESDRATRGGWLVNRLLCLVKGHRHLVPTAAAAKIMPTGVEQEIYLCHACGSYAWRTSNSRFSPT
jgi:hypothetical protein